MSKFEIQLKAADPWLIAHLRGRVEILSPEGLADALEPVLNHDNHHVVLDMAELTFINSVALGVLIDFRLKLKSLDGELRLAGASDRIADVFRQTRLVEVFPIYEDAITATES